MSKWSKKYWQDLAERTATAGLSGVLAVITGDNADVWHSKPSVWWTVVGIPVAVSLIKGLIANMGTTDLPSASAVGVTSTTSPPPSNTQTTGS